MNNIMYRVGVSIVGTFKEKYSVVYHLRIQLDVRCDKSDGNGKIVGIRTFQMVKERCKGGFEEPCYLYINGVLSPDYGYL